MRQLQRDVRPQLLRRDPVDHLFVGCDDALGLARLEHALAEQRRVRVEALLVQPAEDGDAFVERLARDEASRAEPHPVPPDDGPARAGCRLPRGSPCAAIALTARVQLCESSHSLHLAHPVLEQRQVAVGVVDPGLASDMCAASHRRARRDEPVVAALERGAPAGRSRRGRSPTAGECEVVVDPAVDSRASACRSASMKYSASPPVSTARSAGPRSVAERLRRAPRPWPRDVPRSPRRKPQRVLACEREVELDLSCPRPCPPGSRALRRRRARRPARPSRRRRAARRRAPRTRAHGGRRPRSPSVANRSRPSASAIAATSGATAATSGPRCGSSRRSPARS